jgi:hypothetical protein
MSLKRLNSVEGLRDESSGVMRSYNHKELSSIMECSENNFIYALQNGILRHNTRCIVSAVITRTYCNCRA